MLNASQISYYKLAQPIYQKKLYLRTGNNTPTQPYRLKQQKRQTPRARTSNGKQQLNYPITNLLDIVNDAIDCSLPFQGI